MANRDRQELVEEFSHELRTPLTSLSNNIARLGLCLRRGSSTTAAELAASIAQFGGDALQDIERLTTALDRLLPRSVQRHTEPPSFVEPVTDVIEDRVEQARSEHAVSMGAQCAINKFHDIEAMRRALAATQEAQSYAESIFHAVRSPLVVLSADRRVLTANRAFYERLGVDPEGSGGSSQVDGHEAKDPVSGATVFIANARRIKALDESSVIFLSIDDPSLTSAASSLD